MQVSLPLLKTAFRSARMSASSMKWVVNKMTLFSLILCNRLQMARRDDGSMPDVGSSKIKICFFLLLKSNLSYKIQIKSITFGSPISAIAMHNLRFWPPLKSFERVFFESKRSTLLRRSSICRFDDFHFSL